MALKIETEQHGNRETAGFQLDFVPGFFFDSSIREHTMSTFFSAVQQFADDENGITAIEYGLIAALMAGAIAAMINVVTGNGDGLTGLSGIFTRIATALNAQVP